MRSQFFVGGVLFTGILAAGTFGVFGLNRTIVGAVPQTDQPLAGFVDMHAHPMTNLAFGGKLIHGAPDVGALIPTDVHCRNGVRATNWAHALEIDNATHGGWGTNNTCGDVFRQQVIDKLQTANGGYQTPDGAWGSPTFAHWPKWDDITHQKMYIEWIQRAHSGGLRVMVALATHNETLAAAVSGPGDGPPDDKASADLQIREIKALAGRHPNFMEVARTSADIRRIVGSGKLAVVLGVEIDNIGNLNKLPPEAVTPALIRIELQRLYDTGVRYIFPTHVIDNLFGGTAVYEANFNLSNYHVNKRFWSLRCADTVDSISYRYRPEGFNAAFEFVKVVKLGLPPGLTPPAPPQCGSGRGHMNTRGLTALGDSALRAMMKLGMLIDVDHMSQRAVNRALEIAAAVPGGGYPLNSGHNGARATASGGARNENTRTDAQMRQIAALGGMFGMGSAGITAPTFITNYRAVASAFGNQGIGMATDFNGLVKGIRPRGGSIRYDASFPQSRLGTKAWNYNTEGVAHYGLLADFIRDLRGLSGGTEVVNSLFQSAEQFAQMWEAAEQQMSRVP